MTDYSYRCTCPIDTQCTCGASVPEYGELPKPPKISPYPCPISGSPLWCECEGPLDLCRGIPSEARS